jgi:hypothetical protein
MGAEAAAWYRRVIAERLRVLMPGNPAVTDARASLGRALLQAGQTEDALQVLSEAAGEYERSRGPTHADTLTVVDDIAAVYLEMGRVADATGLLRRNLADRERAGGQRDVATTDTRARLAAALLAEGEVKDALAQSKRVLADRELVLGKSHPDTIEARVSFATASQAAGRMPGALQAAELACSDSVRVLGADHRDTLMRQLNLAHLYYAVGRVSDAANVLHEVGGRCERVLQAADPLTVAVHQSLTNLEGALPPAPPVPSIPSVPSVPSVLPGARKKGDREAVTVWRSLEKVVGRKSTSVRADRLCYLAVLLATCVVGHFGHVPR